MIRIDVASPRPLEEQIAESLRQALARGEVVPGDELPSVRQLAADLGVHWNTVARAYRRLVDEGLLLARRGRGVVCVEPPRPRRVTRTELRDRFAEAIAAGVMGGWSHGDVVKTFKEALATFGER